MENTQEILDNVYLNLSDVNCKQNGTCLYKERTISYAIGVTIPTETEDPDVVFKECCYVHFVYADLESTDSFKNDYSSFYHQRQLSNETVSFVLVNQTTGDETEIEDDTYGSLYDFGSFEENTNLTGVLIQWRNVLSEFGTGTYKVLKKVTIAGVDVEFPSISFTLRNFSYALVNNTTRIDIVMNGRIEKGNIDFTGVAWKHSLRIPGFFGRREAQFEEDFIIDRNFEKKQISMKQTNEYKFQTSYIPSCLTSEILDFMLFANDIYLNDYNLNNHSYDFVKFGVKFGSNEGTDYGSLFRKARLNLVFTDKIENNLKRNFK